MTTKKDFLVASANICYRTFKNQGYFTDFLQKESFNWRLAQQDLNSFRSKCRTRLVLYCVFRRPQGNTCTSVTIVARPSLSAILPKKKKPRTPVLPSCSKKGHEALISFRSRRKKKPHLTFHQSASSTSCFVRFLCRAGCPPSPLQSFLGFAELVFSLPVA